MIRRHNTVELEVGEIEWMVNDARYTRPAAFIKIESEDKELLEKLIGALTQVEDLEVK